MSENYKNIDDLFRDKFSDFELDPPDHVWANVKQTVHGPIGSNPGTPFRKITFIGLSSIIILVGLFSLYQLQFSSPNDGNLNSKSTEDTFLSSNNANQDSILLGLQSTRGANPVDKSNLENESPYMDAEVISSDDIASNISLSTNSIKNINPSPIEEPTGRPAPGTKLNENKLSDIVSSDIDSELLAIGEFVAQNDKDEFSNNKNIVLSDESDEIIESVPTEPINPDAADINAEIKSDYGRTGAFVFGLFFTPEMIYYPSDQILTNKSYSLDINAIYKFSGYLLQSGLGIARSTDDGAYRVDYNKYLGSYEDVYNVTFDTTGGDINPVYHTETVNVFDTVTHVTINPTKNRYTYLQIPLLFGYGNENKRFGWFVKGGPSLSILIDDKKPDIYVPNEQYRLLSVENEIPARIKTHWQFVLSAGGSFRLSNNLSISVEPMLRYYLKSAYETKNTTTKHPYSFGLRAGFLLNF